MNAEVVAETVPEKKEFWRWQENVWIDETKDWKTAKIVTCGIDVGSVSSQA
jgi:benzoyl-CoA reductase subunit A